MSLKHTIRPMYTLTHSQKIILTVSFKKEPVKSPFYSYPLNNPISLKKPVLSMSVVTFYEKTSPYRMIATETQNIKP
jgi:hypothetical protein